MNKNGSGVLVSEDAGDTWRDFYPERFGSKRHGGSARFHALAAGPDFLIAVTQEGTFYRHDLSNRTKGWEEIERRGVPQDYEGAAWYDTVEKTAQGSSRSGMNGESEDGAIAIDPRDPSHWFFANRYALYQTRDAGRNWTLSRDGIEASTIYALAQDPVEPGVVHLSAGRGGYFLSEDGASRFAKPRAMGGAKTVALSPAAPSRVYITGTDSEGWWAADKAYVSVDRGAAWTKSPLEGLRDTTSFNFSSIAVDPQNSYHVYVTASERIAPGAGGVYESRDGGKSWAWIGQGLPSGAVYDSFFRDSEEDDRRWRGREIAVSPDGALMAVWSYGKSVYSRAPGASVWEKCDIAPLRGGATPCEVAADPKTAGRFYLAVTGGGEADGEPSVGGVLRTRNGGKTWERAYTAASAEHVSVDAARPERVIAGTSDGPVVSFDGGDTWKSLDKRLPARENTVVAFAGDRVVVGTRGAGAFWMPLTPSAAKVVKARRVVVPPLPGAAGIATAAAQSPRLVNADFHAPAADQTPTGWTLRSQKGQTTAVRDARANLNGAPALRVASEDASTWGRASSPIENVRPGVSFILTGYARVSGSPAGASVSIEGVDAAGKPIEWAALASVQGFGPKRTFFRKTVILPPSVSRVNLVVGLYGKGAIYLDSVTLSQQVPTFLADPVTSK